MWVEKGKTDSKNIPKDGNFHFWHENCNTYRLANEVVKELDTNLQTSLSVYDGPIYLIHRYLINIIKNYYI